MRITKIAAAAACGLTSLLLTLTFMVKNPETGLYEQTIETLMEQENLASSQEVEERFPVLIDIQAKLGQIADLKQIILDKTQNPAPIITQGEVLQLDYCREKIHHLRKSVSMELSQLIIQSIDRHP